MEIDTRSISAAISPGSMRTPMTRISNNASAGAYRGPVRTLDDGARPASVDRCRLG
jgi:hypothetical protein